MREGRWLWHCGGGGNPFVSGQRYICSAAGGRRWTDSTNIVVGDATSKSAYFKGFRGSSISTLARGTTITCTLFGPPARGMERDKEESVLLSIRRI